jgi:simple sugar transport system ATP-binding protein
MADSLLKLENVNKWFGKVHVLKDVNIDFKPGEVVGLVGDNGAGKSTLIKIISGYHQAEKGTIYWEGKKIKMRYPKNARDRGIETVYQEQALAPHLSIARNVFMGREPSHAAGFMKSKEMDEDSLEALESLGLHIPSSETLVSKLSGGQRQGVAIARALHFEAKLVILDEPTVALSVGEVKEVLDFVRLLKEKGVATIFITHNLYHVYSVADRIVVLAQGEVVKDIETKDTTVDGITDMIVSSTMGAVV